MLSLALSSWSLHRHLPYFGTGSWRPDSGPDQFPVTEFPAVARSYGIADLEVCQMHLASTDPSYIGTVLRSVQAAGCRVLNMPIDAAGLSQGDQPSLDLLCSWIDTAQTLGATSVRVNTGHLGTLSEAEAMAHVVRGYRYLAAYCAERQITLLLENHWGLSASPEAIIALHREVGAANFRLCPDFGNFAPEVRMEGLRAMLPLATMVHAKCLDIDDAGNHPAFDLAQCFALVRESGYAGPLSIEFEGKGDQRRGIAESKRMIERYVGDLLITQ